MSYTLTQHRTMVRAKLDTAASGGTWGTELDDYINQAIRYVARSLPDPALGSTLNTSETTVLTATPTSGMTTVALPSTISRLISVSLTDDDGALYSVPPLPSARALRDRVENARSTATGAGSRAFAYEGNKILVYRVESGDSITVWYVKTPTVLSATTDTSELPDEHIDVVIDKATAIALMQIGKMNEAAIWDKTARSQIAEVYQRFSLEPPRAFLDVPEKR